MQAIASNLKLTLADIAEQNRTVTLNPAVILVIPDRITIPNGLPSTTTIPENATLASITSNLLAARKADGETGFFSAADVAIANQSVVGLIEVGKCRLI